MGTRHVLALAALLAATPLAAGCGLEVRNPGPALLAPAPSFTLTDHRGEKVSLADLTRRGPAVLVFYRGYW